MMITANLTFSRMASLALAIFVSAPVVAQSDNQAMVDLVIKVQQLQDEVRTLTGRLEDQNAELQRLSDRQRDQYLDLDQRINELRGGSSMAVGAVTSSQEASAAVNSPATDVPQIRTAQDAPEVRAPLNAPSAVTALPVPDVEAREIASSPEAEKAAYDQAFQSLKQLKYADAADQFTGFLRDYPGSDYADNAQYWLGESYYVTRNYDFALDAFKKLRSKYPDSPKAADSLLKIGYTHYELKQWDQARAALEQVEAQHPGTTLARLAASRLRSMKLEGTY